MGNFLYLATLAYQPTSFLDGSLKTSVEHGMLDMSATVKDVLLISVPVVIGVVGLTVAINFAIGKVRSIASWAN